MSETTIRTLFKGKEQVAERVKRFIFDPDEKVYYQAGQFGFFDFTLNGEQYSKHFTFSNSPENKEMEFTTMIRDSKYKKALDSLEKGHEVFIRDVNGDFTLEKAKTLIFLAGGIGITPVKSMLEYAADSSMEIKAKLFYSNRKENTISYREHLSRLKDKLKTLDIVHTLTDLSDTEEKTSWRGETGYIDARMLNEYLETTKECVFYISGPPSFNNSMKKMLLEDMDVRKENIKVENFPGY